MAPTTSSSDADRSAGDALDDGPHGSDRTHGVRREIDRLDPSDRLTVTQHPRFGEQLVEDRRLDAGGLQRRSQHRWPGSLGAVGDLQGDGPAVRQGGCVDTLGTILGDQPRECPGSAG